MIKRNNKKGFTIVELVIVIAVIAILAAVLIPTFAGIIKKANISADTQLCKNMNTALSMAKAEGEVIDDVEDVLRAINEAGYVIENLNPTTEGYYFAWDEANGQILFLNNEFAVHYPEDVTLDAAKCWITVGDAEEANKVADKGFALYLEPGFGEPLELGDLVSVDAGVNVGATLSMADADSEGTVTVRGNYANVTLNVPKADVEQHGAITKLTVTAVKDGTLKINGYVEEISIAAGKVVVNNTGVIEKIADATSAAKIDGAKSTGLILESTNTVAGYTAPSEVTISNKAELEAFRDAVNSGYTYARKKVTLTADIDLAGTAWLPIGNFARKSITADDKTGGFRGTFDGNGHAIKNLSNEGFSITGLIFGSNDSTPNGRSEAVYGLFGCVYNAEILNLTVTADIKMADDGTFVGDSVGAIVGFAAGDSFKMNNCTSNGTVIGFDAVGGLLGRSYAKTTAITNSTNNANVTADQNDVPLDAGYAIKAGGFAGYISSTKAAIDTEGSKNTGKIQLANVPDGRNKLFSNSYIYTDGGAKPNND